MLPPHLLMMFHFHCLCYLLICWWCFTFTFYVTSWSVDYVLLSLSTLPPDLLIMFNFHFLCYLLIRWWASLVPDLWFHRWQSKAAKSFFQNANQMCFGRINASCNSYDHTYWFELQNKKKLNIWRILKLKSN